MNLMIKLIALAALLAPARGAWSAPLDLKAISTAGQAVPKAVPQASKAKSGSVLSEIIGVDSKSGSFLRVGDKEADRRPPRLLSVTPEGASVVSNVKWGYGAKDKPLWDKTAINPNMLEEVYWGRDVDKDGGAGHAFMVFRFKPGGLVSSRKGATRSNSLVLSVEARLNEGEAWSAVPGALGAYKIIWMLYSMETYIEDTYPGEVASVDIHPLTVSLDQKKGMLKTALETAVKERDDEYYNTVYNNCTTCPLWVINSQLGPLQGVLAVKPTTATKLLIARGLIPAKPVRFTANNLSGGGFIKPHN